MAEKKILFLGGAGYAGGAILHHLMTEPSFPSNIVELTAIVRQDDQAASLKEHYPDIKTIVGTLDDAALLTTEAAKADIVVQAADVDLSNANDALMTGLASKKAVGGTSKGTFIVISGAGCFLEFGPSFEPGARDNKVWSDIDDMEAIWNLPHERIHVANERKLVTDGEAGGVNTVILSPPMIYKSHYGCSTKESWYEQHIKAMLDIQSGFIVNKGENKVSWISTEDLADVIGLVLKDVIDRGEKVKFGKDGYYQVEAGELAVKDVATIIADELCSTGLLESSRVVAIDSTKAAELHPMGPMLWGSNMRIKADKVKIELGWKPKVQEWEPLIRNLVRRVGRKQ